MPIEFRCRHCGALLKTPDDSAGQQAKCPQCGALTMIPHASIAQSTPPDNAIAETQAGGTRPTRISVDDVMSRAWRVYKHKMGLCIGGNLIYWIIFGVIKQAVKVGIN